MKPKRTPLVIAALSLLLVIGILVWRGLAPEHPVLLSNAQATPVMGEEGVVHVYLTIEAGELPDLLLGANSSAATGVEIVKPVEKEHLAIPARSEPSLSSDGVYLRLTGVEGVLDEGRLIPVSLIFGRSGELSTRARIGENTDPHARHMAMAAMADLAQDGPAPSVTMSLDNAANGGTAVRLDIENFTFDPGSEPPEHVPGHGHAHLYLDGMKLQRMYTTDALIGALPPGEYDVRVELNTNVHVPYQDKNGPVEAKKILVVQ